MADNLHQIDQAPRCSRNGNAKLIVALITCSLLVFVATPAGADTTGTYLRSVEWLVDTSEVVFVGKKEQAGVSVLALVKSVPSMTLSYRVGARVDIHMLDSKKRLGTLPYDEEYSAPEFETDDRAVFFLRLATDGKAYCTKRISLDEAIGHEMGGFFGIDRRGNPIPTPVALLRLVRRRVKLGSVVPIQLDREAAEANDSLRPFNELRLGAQVGYSPSPLSVGDWAFMIVVPMRPKVGISIGDVRPPKTSDESASSAGRVE